MRVSRAISTLFLAHVLSLALLGGGLGCGGDRRDDDEDLGSMVPGESDEVEINVFAAEPVFLEECEDAFIVSIEGPDGEDASDVIDAEITDAITRTSRGECETDVLVTVGFDAPPGDYTIEIVFTYFVVGDDDEEDESGFIDFTVVDVD